LSTVPGTEAHLEDFCMAVNP